MNGLELTNICIRETEIQIDSIKTMEKHNYYNKTESKKRIREEYERATNFIKSLYDYNIIDRELCSSSISKLVELAF